MVFNATFSIISSISWRSILLVEETGYPEKTTDLTHITDKLGTSREFTFIVPNVKVKLTYYQHFLSQVINKILQSYEKKQ
jgi:hypothetical protein